MERSAYRPDIKKPRPRFLWSKNSTPPTSRPMSTNSTISRPSGCVGSDRDTVGIAWSCIAVIFACAWKAVHPEVPPESLRQSTWKLARRRLYMTLWTILLPELVVARAVFQWMEARDISEEYKQQHTGDDESNTDPMHAGDVAQPKYRKCVHHRYL